MFATLTFFLPFVIITVCNGMIVHSLYRRHVSSIRSNNNLHLRKECLFILFAISVFNVAFHISYFVVWCRWRIITNPKVSPVRDNEFWDYWNGVLFICRLIYYLNYCLNFVLYCVTGSNFRSEMFRILLCKRQEYIITTTHGSTRSMHSFTRKRRIFSRTRTTSLKAS